jgi:hypothetical protein
LVVGLVLGFRPTRQPFEGSLTVSQLDFTTTRADQLFLRDLRLKSLTISGVQTLALSGQFTNPSRPNLSTPLRNTDLLQIELPEATSQWTLVPESDTFDLSQLRLQQNSAVEHLHYNPATQIFSFNLTPLPQTNVNANNSNSNNFAHATNPPSQLDLNLGNIPLTLILERYRSPQLNQTNLTPYLSLTWQTPQAILDLSSPLSLYAELETITHSEFQRDLAVAGVKFEIWDEAGTNLRDNVDRSSIQGGIVGMAGQQLQLQNHQFLTIAPPGVQTLRRLQIQPPEPDTLPGFSLDISGQTDKIEVGLNPQLPVAQIQAIFFNQFLPRDGIIALVSFTSALILNLLAWLIDYDDRPS